MLYDSEHDHAAVKIQHMFREHQRKVIGREIWRDAEEVAKGVPDPGAYEVDSAFDDKNMGEASSAFKSQTMRDPFYADRHTLAKDVGFMTPANAWTASNSATSTHGQRAFADTQQRYDGAGSIFEHTKRQIPGLEHSPYKESQMLYDSEHDHAAVKIQHMFRKHVHESRLREIARREFLRLFPDAALGRQADTWVTRSTVCVN